MDKMTWEVVETLAVVEVNETNRLVVDVNRSNTGLTNVGIREFYTRDGMNWFPGKKGLALKPSQWAEIAPAIDQWVAANQNAVVAQPAQQAGGRQLVVGKKQPNAAAPRRKPNKAAA